MMNLCIGQTPLKRWQRALLTTLHWMVLVASGALIVWITRDTLSGEAVLYSHQFRRFQLWMCLLFQLDIIVEWALAPRKWRYIARHIFFILISIPYLSIAEVAGVHPSSEGLYLLGFVPMIRAAFVFAIVTGALTSSKAMSTFYVYLIWVCGSLLFAALMFFEGEHAINPQVDTFWTALWWAGMSMTTAGCYVTPMTTTGNVLEVFLSAEGMMLIPVFTVFFTRSVIGHSAGQKSV